MYSQGSVLRGLDTLFAAQIDDMVHYSKMYNGKFGKGQNHSIDQEKKTTPLSEVAKVSLQSRLLDDLSLYMKKIMLNF